MTKNKYSLITIAVFTLVSFLLDRGDVHANCFMIVQGDKILKSEGDCTARHAPCSTFKIAISLMGFDEGILQSEDSPRWPFQVGYADYLETWKTPQTPQTWMQQGCVWYSQKITKKLGEKKFAEYLKRLNYGNQDASGDPGQNNGLTRSWLSSSLAISGEEQVAFLKKLINKQLLVTKKAQEKTIKILYQDQELAQELAAAGWKLYGKTGSGEQKGPNGERNPDRKIGWFVGWLENPQSQFQSQAKDGQTMTSPIIFAFFEKDETKIESYAGPRARLKAIELLKKMLLTQASK